MSQSESFFRQQLEDVIKNKNTKSEQADAAIFCAIGLSSAMGVAPFGINIVVGMLLNSVLLAVLGGIYDYYISLEEAGKLVQKIILSAGFTYAANVLGWKIIIELAKVFGVTTAGSVTAIAMGVDAVLFGALTFAIGFTGKDYFASGRGLTDKQIANKFKDSFKKGKDHMK